MSKVFDAKQAVLKAYPKDKEDGVDLFFDILDVGQADFEYEYMMTPEVFIYGEDDDYDPEE